MTVKVGFIGVGGVAQPHLKNIDAMAGATVEAVCDLDEARMNSAAETFKAKPFKDWKKMLGSADLDALYICLFPSAHGNMEVEIARMGIPFFIEKPIHLSLATAKKVTEAVKARNTITAVGYHWRAAKRAQKARSFLEGKTASLVQGWWFGGMPGVWWWRRKKESGGQHVEQTTHIYDLARYLAGDVEKVYAAATRGAMKDIESYDVEDASTAVLEFKSGAVGTIVSGCITSGTGKPMVGLRVDGRGWTVDLTAGGRLSIAKAGKPVEFEDASQPFEIEGKAFVQAVKTDDPSRVYCDYEDGMKSLAVTLAVDKAIQTGKTQKVQA